MSRLKTLNDVVAWRLCLGCGACAYICPDNRVKLFDFLAEGIRPVAETNDCGDCRLCLDVCPGVAIDFRCSSCPPFRDPPAHPSLSLTGGEGARRASEGEVLMGKARPVGSESPDPEFSEDFVKEWGPIVALWEGHATDPEIRFKGSSGGALTALGAYCVEVLGMHGVLHIAQDPEDPIRNRTRLSRSRAELLAASGSRYSPASVCNGLGLVEAAQAPCAVIGRPFEIAAVCNARRLRPALDAKIGLTMSFFCAEAPSTRGTTALLEKLGVNPVAVSDLRYRGFGWPGHFAPVRKGETEPCHKMTYRESWAFLQAYRPWSVQMWPDSSGELADISCGDPWYEQPDGHNPGFSLVVARTERGRKIIEGAMAAGYLNLKPAENWKLVRSQSGLLAKKGAVWGRRLAMRLVGLPVPRLTGVDLWHCWRKLSLQEKLRSTLGTFRRVLARKLRQPLTLTPLGSVPVKMTTIAKQSPPSPKLVPQTHAGLSPSCPAS